MTEYEITTGLSAGSLPLSEVELAATEAISEVVRRYGGEMTAFRLVEIAGTITAVVSVAGIAILGATPLTVILATIGAFTAIFGGFNVISLQARVKDVLNGVDMGLTLGDASFSTAIDRAVRDGVITVEQGEQLKILGKAEIENAKKGLPTTTPTNNDGVSQDWTLPVLGLAALFVLAQD